MADILYNIGGGGGGGGTGPGSGAVTPYANFAALPAAGNTTGDVAITVDTGVVYWWDGSVWDPIDTELASVAVNDTNSIDLTVTGGVLTADLRLSAAAADAGFFNATASIETDGIQVQAQIAATAQTGFLSSADWNTFNNKEPAISAGTTSQYWRGDKSFQTLNSDALLATTDGSSAGAGKLSEILTATQAANTTTGVAASGVYGNVTSLSVTAGDWIIYGTVAFNENGANLTDFVTAGISASSSGAGIDEFNTTSFPYIFSASNDIIVGTPMAHVSIAGTTTYYLNTKFNYTSGTPRHRGRLEARRIR